MQFWLVSLSCFFYSLKKLIFLLLCLGNLQTDITQLLFESTYCILKILYLEVKQKFWRPRIRFWYDLCYFELIFFKFLWKLFDFLCFLLVVWFVLWILFDQVFVNVGQLFILFFKLSLLSFHFFTSQFVIVLSDFQGVLKLFLILKHLFKLSSKVFLSSFQFVLLFFDFSDLSFKSLICLFHLNVLLLFSFSWET